MFVVKGVFARWKHLYSWTRELRVPSSPSARGRNAACWIAKYTWVVLGQPPERSEEWFDRNRYKRIVNICKGYACLWLIRMSWNPVASRVLRSPIIWPLVIAQCIVMYKLADTPTWIKSRIPFLHANKINRFAFKKNKSIKKYELNKRSKLIRDGLSFLKEKPLLEIHCHVHVKQQRYRQPDFSYHQTCS